MIKLENFVMNRGTFGTLTRSQNDEEEKTEEVEKRPFDFSEGNKNKDCKACKEKG